MQTFRTLLPALLVGVSSLALAQVQAPAPAPTDPREIVRRSVELDHRNFQVRRNYTFQSREEERELDKQGQVKKTTSETYDHFILYGEHYARLIARDDRPLKPDDERKEQEKLDKFTARRERESESDRQKRLAKLEEERREGREFLREVPEAFDFQLLREEQHAGHDVWVIAARPRPGYRPQQRWARVLPKIQATLWIDKQEYQWVRAEAELIDTFSIGGFLLRLHKGSHLEFDQEKINNEIWFPRRQLVAGSGRLMLLVSGRFWAETTFSNYRRFRTDTRILGVADENKP